MIGMKAYQDLKQSLLNWRIWCALATQDIQLRYRESMIGPFWITISMAVTICVLGFLYSYLFKSSRFEYFPHVASGMICWRLLSSLLEESAKVFPQSKSYLQNIHLPYSMFLCRLFLRNLIILAHNLLVFIPVIFLFNVPVNGYLLLLIPGVIIVGINAVFWGTIIGMIGTRFKDCSQIIESFMRVIFYATPIIWLPELLPAKYHWFIDLNPLQQMLAIMRQPMLGQGLTMVNVFAVTIITLIGFILFTTLLSKYKHRIVFWL